MLNIFHDLMCHFNNKSPFSSSSGPLCTLSVAYLVIGYLDINNISILKIND